ncbi:MAG TPA: A/G-specific adenine glycosylase [Candidatus Limnocylindrales bacterium]|nr:A/G-specific adenine glycosylase [Candidatus Limnocylindrales bacterium]
MLRWYARRGRPLAFRATSDPWAILVSEVMAQQTQAARAAEAWSRFMASYPSPAALASAPLADVLRAWRGLGYNRRAVLLQRAAIAIVRGHRGAVPSDLDALDRLPGVGPYTARAVAALAFGRRVGAVDTNVRRVLTRAFFDDPAGPPADPASLQALADVLAPPTAPGTWTHALMDVGATVCRIRSPRCAACPLAFACAWAAGRRASVAAGVARRERPFTTTSRWLRGRILDRLRDLDDGAWLAFGEAIGTHDIAAVAAALESLRRDALVELRGTAPAEARLPHA